MVINGRPPPLVSTPCGFHAHAFYRSVSYGLKTILMMIILTHFTFSIREGFQEQKLPKSRHSWFGHFDISLEVTAQNEYSSTGAKVAYDCFWTYISFPGSQIKRKVISQWLPKWLKILLTIYFLIKVYRGPGYHALHDNTSFFSLWCSLKRKQNWFGHFVRNLSEVTIIP